MTANPRIHGEGNTTGGNPQGVAAPRRLLALARDPQLRQALQDLGDTNPPLRLADGLTELTDELMKQDPAVVLLDAAAVEAPLEAVVDALNAQFPDLLLMVAGHGGEQSLLASRISEQAVFRFVHKPASPQRLRLFLDAAARAAPRLPPPPVPGRAAKAARSVAASNGASPPPRGGLRLSSFHIGIAALALAVLAGWLLWPRAPISPPAAMVAPESQQQQAREQELDQALRTAEAALLAGNLQEAAAATAEARTLQPDNPRAAFLSAQLEREQARATAEAQAQQEQDASEAQLRNVLTRMSERLRAGALLEPLDDSAAALFRDARRMAPNDPAVLIARDALVSALLTAADKELFAGRAGEARQLVDVSARLHPAAPGLELIRLRINEATQQSQVAAQRNAAPPPATTATPAEATPADAAPGALDAQPSTVAATPAPATDAPATAPAPPPASTQAQVAAAAPAADAPSAPASTLKVIRRAEAKYPQQAWEQQISGWVEMEFTIATDGTTRDIRVTASEPSRIFDSAAVAALRRYRYEPVVRNGSPVELRARMRLRFTAEGKD